MNPTILNREFNHPSDGWYHIEALGEHPNRPAGLIQVIDAAAAAEIVNRFNREASAGELRHGHELLVDHEHFSEQPDQESRAYGWLQELQNRADGIYGRIRWTATGKAAVDGGDYRFFSTEYAPGDLKVLNGGPPKRVRPVRLDGLTVTNMNNNRGQKPITNRKDLDAASAAASSQQTPNKTPMKTIAVALGLSADVAEEGILAEVTRLKNRADSVVAITTERDSLKNRNTELEAEQVEGLLAERKITDTKVVNRLKPVLAGLKNRADRVAFLDDCGFKTDPTNGAGTARVLNRGEGKPGESTPGDDQAKADKVLNRARELQKSGMKFEPAWEQASREVLAA